MDIALEFTTFFVNRLSNAVMSTVREREMFPEIEPYQSGHLKVSEIHQIYYEQCGKKDGKPIVFV